MNNVNYYSSYLLSEIYEQVKQSSSEILGKYLTYPDLYQFDDNEKALKFKSEKLVPFRFSGRPRVMLLFSNPHPHSVHQGMLLSPNTRGRENPFWETMRNAGWLKFKEANLNPSQIAELCFSCEYEGPFDFVFYPYYAFPTNFPNELQKIFGKEFFNRVIEPEANTEFKKTILETEVQAVVAFNKDIFNLVSERSIDKPIQILTNGELIESRVRDIEEELRIFLTFPTGWRYHKEIRRLKNDSLDSIKTAIIMSVIKR